MTGEGRGIPIEQTEAVQRASWETFNNVWRIKFSNLRKLDQSLTMSQQSSQQSQQTTKHFLSNVMFIRYTFRVYSKNKFGQKENLILLTTSLKSQHALLVQQGIKHLVRNRKFLLGWFEGIVSLKTSGVVHYILDHVAFGSPERAENCVGIYTRGFIPKKYIMNTYTTWTRHDTGCW